jgi:hypothetical protein
MGGPSWPERLAKVKAERDALAAELERVTAALRFYADERNHKSQPSPDAERGHYPTYVPAIKDAGRKARVALTGVARAAQEDK